jgi:putative redox protein
METAIKLSSGLHFSGETPSGFMVHMDGGAAVGGQDKGPRPMEMIAMGLIGCTAMDVISILNKMRQDVTEFEVKLHADNATEHPKVFTKMHIEYILSGRNLEADKVEKAIELSAVRYCPAQAMLSKAAPIETSCKIIDVD